MALNALLDREEFSVLSIEEKIYKKKVKANEADTNVYMLNVLDHFKKEAPAIEFYLILGGDSYKDIENWHQYEKVLENPIIVVTRDDKNNLGPDLNGKHGVTV